MCSNTSFFCITTLFHASPPALVGTKCQHSLKVLANEDTLLLMMFLGRANARDTKLMLCFHAAQTGKHLLRIQNVSEQNQKHFLCPGHKICVRIKCCARGQTFVSATMCPRLPGPSDTRMHDIALANTCQHYILCLLFAMH